MVPASLLGQNHIKDELSQYEVSSSLHLWSVDQVPQIFPYFATPHGINSNHVFGLPI